MRSVAILGGGVSGLTTGVLLQAMGYATTIYARTRADRPGDARPPRVASLYPAASVIPHTVAIDHVAAHLRVAQKFFAALCTDPSFGVRVQDHYEVYEAPVALPAYAEALRHLRAFPRDGRGLPEAPRRPGAAHIFGWAFRVFFAEAPVYVARLGRLYQTLGGRVVPQDLTRASLDALPADIMVNTLGAGAPQLFDDPAPLQLIRGVLVRVPPGTGRRCSYNYTPSPAQYRGADGAAGGLYFYPRGDAWLLGGTKTAAPWTPSGWSGPSLPPPTRIVDGLEVPAAVLDLNATLVEQLTGHRVALHDARTTVGYRFHRTPLRLARDTWTDGRPVLHNYGHGGAGVTLSWSCARQLAHWVDELQPPSAEPPAHPWAQRLRTCTRRTSPVDA